MRLDFESGESIDSPSIADLLRIEGEDFAILSRDENTYIQCAEQTESPWGYILEYQEGSIEAHFKAVGASITLQQVITAFEMYLTGDESWRTQFRWERMDLS